MDNDFKNSKANMREIRLRPDEKEAIRSRLLAHIERHPAQAPEPSFVMSLLSYRFAYAALGVLALVMSTGGAAYASERALPGDLLYPVKLYVSEPVRGALAADPESKARWAGERAERRLAEAELLAAKGELSGGQREKLEKNFTKSTQAFAMLVERAETESGATEETLDVRTSLEATMNAHSELLEQFETVVPEAYKEEIKQLKKIVKTEQSSVARSRKLAQNAFLNKQEPKAAAQDTARSAAMMQTEERAVASLIEKTAGDLEADESSSVFDEMMRQKTETKLERARQALRDAKERGAFGENADAYSALLQSKKIAEEAAVTLDAAKDIEAARGVELKGTLIEIPAVAPSTSPADTETPPSASGTTTLP